MSKSAELTIACDGCQAQIVVSMSLTAYEGWNEDGDADAFGWTEQRRKGTFGDYCPTCSAGLQQETA